MKAWEYDRVDYGGLPAGLREGMRLWIEQGLLPGHFLQAVLRNDLADAIVRADEENLKRLPEIVRWLHNEAPTRCHGEPMTVTRWWREKRQAIG